MSERVRVLVCGSRTFASQDAVTIVLDGISRQYGGNITIIHGAARGADTLADKWAQANGVPVMAFAAQWTKYGKRAGFLRNTQMLEEGKPHIVWAFVDKPLEDSRGTKMMVDIARKAGVHCEVVEAIPTPLEPPVELKGL